jgi:hypothetical protein
MTEEGLMTLLDLIPDTGAMVRRSDPPTSRKAAPAAAERAPSHKIVLLRCYRSVGSGGLTDEEAGERSGLAAMRRCCYWKRCSELRADGLISAAGERLSSAGAAQMVCEITEAGILMLEALDG